MQGFEPGDWKVRIEPIMFCDGIRFYIWRSRSGYTEHLGKDGYIQVVPEGMATIIDPTLELKGFEARSIMAALAEALADQGVKTPNDHRLQGVLDAQTAHLQDMRTPLKLNKPSGESK